MQKAIRWRCNDLNRKLWDFPNWREAKVPWTQCLEPKLLVWVHPLDPYFSITLEAILPSVFLGSIMFLCCSIFGFTTTAAAASNCSCGAGSAAKRGGLSNNMHFQYASTIQGLGFTPMQATPPPHPPPQTLTPSKLEELSRGLPFKQSGDWGKCFSVGGASIPVLLGNSGEGDWKWSKGKVDQMINPSKPWSKWPRYMDNDTREEQMWGGRVILLQAYFCSTRVKCGQQVLSDIIWYELAVINGQLDPKHWRT